MTPASLHSHDHPRPSWWGIALLLTLTLAGPAAEHLETTQDPAACLLAAKQEVDRYRWDQAERWLLRAMELSPDPETPVWRQAMYAAAECRHQRSGALESDIRQAEQRHEALYQAAAPGGHREAGMAAIQIGRIAHLYDYFRDPADRPQARTWYQRAIDGWPQDTLATQATIYLAASWVEDRTPEGFATAARLLEQRAKAHPDDPFNATLWFQLGVIRQLYIKDMAGALAAFQAADRIGAPRAVAWNLVWRMAEIANFELHDRDLAVGYYTRIITDYITSARGTLAQERIRALGVEPPPLPTRLYKVVGGGQ